MEYYDARTHAQRETLESIGALFHCGVLLFRYDGERRILYGNESLSALFGCTHDEFGELYGAFSDCVFPDDRAYVEEHVTQELAERDSYDVIFRAVRKDGSTFWVKESGHRLTAADLPDMLLCTYVDISGDDERRHAVEHRGDPDPLTKALTRDAFLEQARSVLRTGSVSEHKHAMLIVDVDRFERINETFGRAFGDKVLCDVAQTLRSVIRTGDLLGRLGGDAFVLLLKDVKADANFRRRLEHIRSLLHRPLPEGTEISCSIGVAVLGECAEDCDSLLRRATATLRTAKKEGRNRIAY